MGDMYGNGINSPSEQNLSAPSSGTTQPAPEPQIPLQEQSAMQPKPKMPRIELNSKTLLIGAIIVILAAAGLYIYGSGLPINTHTTTTVLAGPGRLAGCATINAPGTYSLESSIMTPIQAGACINITASNVNLVCNSGKLIGSGPYTGVPPFTYGIEVSGASNVSISGCSIKNFSYGIYAPSSANLKIYNNNITTNYISNIYLKGTHNSSVHDNLLASSSSTEGSLYLSYGSSGNRVYNNTILRNQYYGISVNSTGNIFLNNYINTTPVSFYCSIGNGFKGNNIAVSNLCFNSTGCGFIRCRGTNIPVDLSQVQLGSSINGCGSISMPGSYALTGNVNMGSLVNVSEELPYNTACISIKSSDVALDCRNFGVYNSTTGIAAYDASNVTISNCNVWNSNSGMMLANVKTSGIYNAVLRNDSTGLMLKNSAGDTLSNVKAYSGIYGTYLLNSPSDTFQNFNFSNNRYGIYVNSSLGESFSRGTAVNNSKMDAYATTDSASTGYSLMLSSTCGLTNAQWATCNQHVTANLSYYPISSCGTLTREGSYTLTSNIINSPAACINIMASNVVLNCLSHSITAAQATSGPALYVSNEKNVTIKNCSTLNFKFGVAVYNSSNVQVISDSLNNSNYGIALYNVSYSTVSNNIVTGTTNASIMLTNVRNSNIISNNATYGRMKSVAILLNNSNGNRVLNNIMSTNYAGISLIGSSRNNTINNNTAQFSAAYDYSCNSTSGGINANNGGIDYGTTKLGCHWMAAVTKASPQIGCISALQSTQLMLSGDALYGLNATCFSVYSSDTRINCNGHTVIATNNGSFVQFRNSQNPQLTNCFLKGFSSPVLVVNSSALIMNNTMYVNGTGAAIKVLNSLLPRVQKNNITSMRGVAEMYGINITSSTAGYLLNNTVNGAITAFRLDNVSSFIVQNNTATNSDINGMYITGSTTNQFRTNSFLAKTTGIQCASLSQGSTSNIDNGGTACSSNLGCTWIKSSASTCHS